MSKRLSICLALTLLAISFAYAQSDTKAAAQNTWQVAGLFSMHYQLPRDEGAYQEDGNFTLDANPQILWFPIDGLGVGIESDISYFNGHFKDIELALGPRLTYYLRRSERQRLLLPYIGGTFQSLMKDLDPGAVEIGWSLRLGVGISPVIGSHFTVPIELGYLVHHIESEYGSISYSKSSNRIYLECGIGAFLWKKDRP